MTALELADCLRANKRAQLTALRSRALPVKQHSFFLGSREVFRVQGAGFRVQGAGSGVDQVASDGRGSRPAGDGGRQPALAPRGLG